MKRATTKKASKVTSVKQGRGKAAVKKPIGGKKVAAKSRMTLPKKNAAAARRAAIPAA